MGRRAQRAARTASAASAADQQQQPSTGYPGVDIVVGVWKPVVRWADRLWGRLGVDVPGIGGTRDLKGKERAALRAAGYVKSGSNKWRNPETGKTIKSRGRAIKTARRILRGGGTVVDNTPPPAPPGSQVPPAPYYPPYYGNEPWRPPETDYEYEQTWSELGIDGLRYEDWWGWYPPAAQGFVAPPGIEPPPAYAGAAADILGTILRGAWGILGVLWPSSTADDDEVWVEPERIPRGESARWDEDEWERPEPVREDDYQGSPWGDVEAQPQPQPVDVPLEVPDVWAEPLPDPLEVPLEVPEIYVPRMPEPWSPPPATATPFDWWSLVDQYLDNPWSPVADGRRKRRPTREPDSPPVDEPLTYAQPYALPLAADPCNCAAEKKRKRKGDRCSNPIVRKRKAQRKNGRWYIYTTRELKCPESSRKKRASLPAR